MPIFANIHHFNDLKYLIVGNFGRESNFQIGGLKYKTPILQTVNKTWHAAFITWATNDTGKTIIALSKYGVWDCKAENVCNPIQGNILKVISQYCMNVIK